ncbi:hypothetical protein BGC31_13540 [Komagataeibacter xylinus]|nr:hypothetical protein BGC31_13540 [Komagataeibacter xylinus]RFP07110.1 hypothetical protein BFX83_13430 [Komagataeibacter xylinus]
MSPAQDRKTAAIAGQAGRFQAWPVTLLPIVYPPKPSLREASVTYTHIVYPFISLTAYEEEYNIIVYHIMGLVPPETLSLSIQ